MFTLSSVWCNRRFVLWMVTAHLFRCILVLVLGLLMIIVVIWFRSRVDVSGLVTGVSRV